MQAKGQLWPTRAFYAECAQVRAGRNSRNADFILIARRAIPQPSARRAVKLKNLPAAGRSILRTFLFTTLRHNLRRQPRPLFLKLRRSRHRNPRPKGPSNLRTLRPSGRSILRTLTPKVCPRPIHLKNLSLYNPSTQPSGRSPVNLPL